jgi:antitoxin VapB
MALRIKSSESLKRSNKGHLADQLDAITLRCAALPVLDDRTEDEILDYDQTGLPR